MQAFWLIPLSVISFAVSAYIFYTKSRGKQLVCFVGGDCNKVVRSKYSKIAGVPNELIGMTYSSAVLLFAVPLVFGAMELTETVKLAAIVASGAAAVFSIGLTLVQIFILKELCEYCAIPNAASVLMFVAMLV